MMKWSVPVALIVIMFCAADVYGQSNRNEPHIGYLYPGGGQQGTTFRVIVGGQRMRSVSDVYITGDGVHATFVQHYRPIRSFSSEQRQTIGAKLRELGEKHLAELVREGKVDPAIQWKSFGAGKAAPKGIELPDHPILHGLKDMSLRELIYVRDTLFDFKKRQINNQIAETALIEITIDSDAKPGDRELRLVGRSGLSNPMVFQIGLLPETREIERNDPDELDPLPKENPLELPVLVNGQIMPGDVDRIRFQAKRGQRLVIETHARKLIPYLADAVPGWFQATLTLYDSGGNELASADDNQFDPDPVLLYKILKNGIYELEIRDAIYRGREDFIYRVSIGTTPYITNMFPLGGSSGQETVASIDGWNLSKKRIPLATESNSLGLHKASLPKGRYVSNSMLYVVDSLPESMEVEPNNSVEDAQQITLPQIINGRMDEPGDVDVFRFEGKDGDEIVAEIVARRLHSPLDSLLQLTDASGTVLEWNDDQQYKDGHLHTDMGVLTHHAESCLSAQLPADGVYTFRVTDSQTHGGEEYAYRLRVSPPQPDFLLSVTPSSINIPAGRAIPICVHVLRKDGYDGEINLSLKDAPEGFRLDGARIPAGCDRICMTLSAPREQIDGPFALTIEGRAKISGKTVSHAAIPSEDLMQAFLYRHLIPSQELVVAMTGGKRLGQSIEMANRSPVRLPVGGKADVKINTPSNPRLRELELVLNDPPEGITIGDISVIRDGLKFQLLADDSTEVGLADNLVVELFIEISRKSDDDGAPKQKRRVSLGVLPAIPIEIVKK